jgi:hypothetical protein
VQNILFRGDGFRHQWVLMCDHKVVTSGGGFSSRSRPPANPVSSTAAMHRRRPVWVNSDRARSAPAAPDDRNSLEADVISLSSGAQVSPLPVEVQPGARPTRRAREQVLARRQVRSRVPRRFPGEFPAQSANSLFRRKNSLFSKKNSLFFLAQGIWLQPAEIAVRIDAESAENAVFAGFFSKFPVPSLFSGRIAADPSATLSLDWRMLTGVAAACTLTVHGRGTRCRRNCLGGPR